MDVFIPPKIWYDTCWIIGGGASIPYIFNVPDNIIQAVTSGKQPVSAYSPYLASIHNKNIIGINNAFLLGNWVDILFFGDNSWYLRFQQQLAKWHGLKVTCCSRFGNINTGHVGQVKYMPKHRKYGHGISTTPGMVSWNGNSGAASISLAVQLGVKRIYLLGFDMTLVANNSHWHNKRNKKPPPFAKHLRGFPAIAKDAREIGVSIYNISPNSKIECLPKIPLKEALNG